MKFKNIYQKSEENVEKALLNLWTIGEHPMRGAVKDMFQREPLIAEPVFQSTYGWQPTEDDSWKSFFLPEVIDQIGIGKTYPPYSHQASSWKTLLDKDNIQSIVVTSGTGSGKTECFMYPVINDIVEQNTPGAVQAIFLYPLNALMADQCDRLGELCDKFNGVKFAVYNGNTKEHIVAGTPRRTGEHESQLRARNEIRQTPPQILLSNPSMLEYMLVRGSDQTIMEQSRGKLRWIVIDEAHSYSGSSAVELKYQIRRILDAFGTDISKVRFACTSATIGGDNGTESLKEFIASLTGQDKNKIKVIGGTRQIPELEETELNRLLTSTDIRLSSSNVMRVRQHINECAGLSLKTIWSELHGSMDGYTTTDALEELDKLCELNDLRGKPVLSLRAHFHMRTISGLYTCVNPNCKCNSNSNTYKNITSFAGTSCEHCNSTMLELIQCKECGQFMISGEAKQQTNTVRQHVDHNEITIGLQITDANGDDISNHPVNHGWTPFAITTVEDPYVQPIEEAHATRYRFEKNGLGLFLKQDVHGSYIKLEGNNCSIKCPVCGESESKKSFSHFRVPVDNLNRIVGRVLLEETAQAGKQWGKYISFTDSRQGTAISAKNFNIESERIIAVANLVKALTRKGASIQNDANYLLIKQFYEHLSDPSTEDNEQNRQTKASLLAKLENFEATLSIREASECLYDRRLFDHLKSDEAHIDAYKAAVTRRILGRRTLRRPSAESLGIIEVVYKAISQIKMPQCLENLRKYDGTPFTDQDWRDFLVIALDYEIRVGNSIQPLIPYERQYIREGNLSTPIKPNTDANKESKKWPKVNKSKEGKVLARQNRLVLLLCAAMGIDTTDRLSQKAATINSLLSAAWENLTDPQYSILTKVVQNGEGYNDQRYYNDEHVGSYYLDISPTSNSCEVKLLSHAWQCPITHRLLNVIFCGYSPAMTGNVDAKNFERFKVTGEKIEMPKPPSVDIIELRKWIDTDPKVQILKQNGLWSDLQDNYYLTESSYIAAEHSAQQSDDKLSEFTEKFKSGSINVLNCSTTMEMGVDIGDIEVVLMDTVPPGADNYLQRAGRAGRARQSKATAFTLCNASPIGMKAFHNPMWALQENNEMKMVKESPVIIQRHINSFLLHYYINENIGKFTTVTSLEDFFGSNKKQPNSCRDFISKLHSYATNNTLKSDFCRVFDNTQYSVNLTVQTITSIMNEYWEGMDNLQKQHDKVESDFNSNPNDSKAEKAMNAISRQILRVRRENLLSYLSEKQFIPNANMPTGIVEFDYSDESTMRATGMLRKEMKTLKSQIEQERASSNDSIRIENYEIQLREVNEKLDRINNSTTVSRDVRTALNEYAPGQTVVINERNYVSNGIALWDNMDGQPRRRFLYHCESCGHTKYSTYQLDDGCTCESCRNDNYVSVIPRLARRNYHYTEAYEPIKFRTTSNARTTRTEITERRYFDIRAELTSLSWAYSHKLNNIDFVRQQEGEIVYYNLGMGEGFAICSVCGRSVLDTADNKEPLREHSTLDGDPCVGGVLKRHIAFTGRQQTCYTAMRFYQNGTLSKDAGLAISMGVVLKRALVKYLHIDSNEIEFGIKNEKDAVVLFIYDVNKGGCGYSMHLGDPGECQTILDIALQMLKEFSCHCENDVSGSGACSHCLIDRTTYRYRDLLSKAKAYAWLLEQKGNSVPVPDEIASISPKAISRHESLGVILQKAALDRNVSEIGICVSAKAGIEASDFSNVSNPIGKALNDALNNSKVIHVYVEYNDDIDDFDTLYQLSNLKQQLVNFKVVPVKSLGEFPMLMLLKTDNGYKHIFTDESSEKLSLSSDWGDCTSRIFEDNLDPNAYFESTTLPNMSQIKAKLATKGRVILEGDIPDKKYSVKNIFTQGVCVGIVKKPEYIDLMQDILKDQHVSVNFSDAYVNSALAGMILTYMIAEIRDLFSCKIDNVTLQLESHKRNIGSDYNDYQPISRNFADEESCNKFLHDQFEDVLGIDYDEKPNTKHHRWLRFTSPKGTLEIRPDHGIDGGWFTRVTYNDLNGGRDPSDIFVSKSGYGTADIVYYIIMNKK